MGLKEDIKGEFCKKKLGFCNCCKHYMYKCQFWDVSIPLLIFRLVAAAFCLSITSLVFASPNGNGDGNFGSGILFFTVWSFILVTLYFVVSAVISIVHVAKDRGHAGSVHVSHSSHDSIVDTEGSRYSRSSPAHPGEGEELEDFDELPWYMKVQWTLYNIALPSAILVTIIYWAALFPMIKAYNNNYETNWFDICIHALNSVLMISESYLNHIPVRILHAYQGIIYGLIYVLFSVIVYFTMNHKVLYPYILDWSRPGITIACLLGVILYYCVTFFIMFIVTRLKYSCNCCHRHH